MMMQCAMTMNCVFLGGVVDYVSNYNNVWLVGLSFIAALDQTFSETAPVGWSREREREKHKILLLAKMCKYNGEKQEVEPLISDPPR